MKPLFLAGPTAGVEPTSVIIPKGPNLGCFRRSLEGSTGYEVHWRSLIFEGHQKRASSEEGDMPPICKLAIVAAASLCLMLAPSGAFAKTKKKSTAGTYSQQTLQTRGASANSAWERRQRVWDDMRTDSAPLITGGGY